MIKTFSTLAVAGVATGRLLKAGRFDDIREVMDHLFPGIMTAGCAAMAPTAAKEILRQIPALSRLPAYSDPVEEYAQQVLILFGSTLRVDGPMTVAPGEIAKAFDALGSKS